MAPFALLRPLPHNSIDVTGAGLEKVCARCPQVRQPSTVTPRKSALDGLFIPKSTDRAGDAWWTVYLLKGALALMVPLVQSAH